MTRRCCIVVRQTIGHVDVAHVRCWSVEGFTGIHESGEELRKQEMSLTRPYTPASYQNEASTRFLAARQNILLRVPDTRGESLRGVLLVARDRQWHSGSVRTETQKI